MASNMQFTASASLTVTGTTPLVGPTENSGVDVNFSTGNIAADDKIDAVYTINANTSATAISMDKIVTGKMLWLATNSPIVATLTQDLGAGPVALQIKVETLLFLPATFTALSLANPLGQAAKVALVIAGLRAPIGGGAGIY